MVEIGSVVSGGVSVRKALIPVMTVDVLISAIEADEGNLTLRPAKENQLAETS